MKYKVELDVYCGPLDLLMHLIKRDELEILRIPVARVADQFVSFLEKISDIDIEVAGDFLVMAARLTEMKSRSLLPTVTTDDEEIDPDLLADETDLIQRLLEYRVFKDISRKLRKNWELRAFRFGRAMFPEFVEEPRDDTDILEGVTVMDMFSAFQRIAKEVQLEESRTIFYDDIPIERHIERVLDRLISAGAFAFSHIFPRGVRKSYIIGAFIALLELVKQKKVSVVQDEDFDEITIGEHVMPPLLPDEDETAIIAETGGQAPVPEPGQESGAAGEPEPPQSPEGLDAGVAPRHEPASPPDPYLYPDPEPEPDSSLLFESQFDLETRQDASNELSPAGAAEREAEEGPRKEIGASPPEASASADESPESCDDPHTGEKPAPAPEQEQEHKPGCEPLPAPDPVSDPDTGQDPGKTVGDEHEDFEGDTRPGCPDSP